MSDKQVIKTSVSVLGTLAEFHKEPIPYDLAALVELVTDINPDFLCLDMTEQQWKNREFGGLPPEYGEALLPLAEQSDIVVVPVGDNPDLVNAESTGLRSWLISWLRKGLAYVQRTAPGPDAINHGIRHDIANWFYHGIQGLSDKDMGRGREVHVNHLTEQVLQLAQRDPGTRVLVIVNVQYCHHIRPKLQAHPAIQEKRYSEL
ncbi:MAG: hypothetical protein DWQ07_17980 [Chloroflexi bacterium]|nr:MAG: hypothetical protein DWQ07_17980 [Chloroflexota bacterium]MBL1197456.1 hypothetical protein [Chloroflexota bacterium]NOH14751.1 hypothetical protein [Chloroflexota bacterium]